VTKAALQKLQTSCGQAFAKQEEEISYKLFTIPQMNPNNSKKTKPETS